MPPEPEGWRARLRAAIDASGKKHYLIAMDAGISPRTLSRILNGYQPRPSFEIVVNIAHAAGVTIGELLGEEPTDLTDEEAATLRAAVDVFRRDVPK